MAWTSDETIRGQKSKAPPALMGGGATALHMVHLGNTSNQIYYSFYDGIEWSRERPVLNQKSKASPAIAGGTMVHLGTSSNRIWISELSGGTWGKNVVLNDINPVSGQGGSTVAPALANIPIGAIPDERVAMVYKEAGNTSLNYKFLSSGKSSRTGGLTRTAPALAFHGGTLHMVHIGKSSNNMWHSIWDVEREVWVEKKIEGQKSKSSPALVSFDGRLHMVHLGNSSNDIWHSIYVDDLRSWTEDKIEGQKSKASPALGVFNNRLHMVHLGNSSNKIRHSEWQID